MIFFTFANYLILILTLAIVVQAVLSWFPGALESQFGRILTDITEPVLAPLRRIVPRVGMIDITPMVAILVLFFIQQLISQASNA
jgi:YggT family protein